MAFQGLGIRYSGSGPFIENAEGAIANPGEGFQLRMVDLNESIGVYTMSSTPAPLESNAGPTTVSLPLPKAGLRYSAQVIAQFEDATPYTFNMSAYWSVDGGSYAQPLVANTLNYAELDAGGGRTSVVYTSPLTLGSVLGVLDDSLLLSVQFYANASVGTPDLAGTRLFARLIETL
jgi:hypothetical protein